ncbi:MAG TPA: riboflavin synthase [Burkholderiaceae bacterium]|nr:riboflavin synthase [Burkholderiaceae bacterium]
MFTGIVSAVGQIVDVTPQNVDDQDAGVRLTIQVRDFLRPTTRIGDSIAIQGACMTVVEMPSRASDGTSDGVDAFVVDVSRESLNKTAGLDRPGPVNLEHSLRMGDTLDGHLVSGHIDGLGTVSHFAPVGESHELRIRVPAELAPYLAYKGSITVNGVSLTINQVSDGPDSSEISINLIPHTVQVTTLQHLKAGDRVNLEIDMIARYVERSLTYRQQEAAGI